VTLWANAKGAVIYTYNEMIVVMGRIGSLTNRRKIYNL
jgi:hypothetical protein